MGEIFQSCTRLDLICKSETTSKWSWNNEVSGIHWANMSLSESVQWLGFMFSTGKRVTCYSHVEAPHGGVHSSSSDWPVMACRTHAYKRCSPVKSPRSMAQNGSSTFTLLQGEKPEVMQMSTKSGQEKPIVAYTPNGYVQGSKVKGILTTKIESNLC